MFVDRTGSRSPSVRLGENSYVSVFLTRRCALRCQYCGQDGGERNWDDFSFSAFCRVLSEARQIGFSCVSITGGDPLCYPQFEKVLKAVEESGLWLFLETNGRLVSERVAQRLGDFARRLTCRVSLTLDSVSPERHDRFRGKGAHAAALAALARLRSHEVVVQVCKTLLPDEVSETWRLQPFLDWCRTLGVARVDVGRVVPMGRGQAEWYRLSSEQIQEVRRQLMACSGYGTFVCSDDFLLAREASPCRRIAGESQGVFVTNNAIAPCSFLPELVLGVPADLVPVVSELSTSSVHVSRETALASVDPESVWGCPECRLALVRGRNGLGAAGLGR